MGQPAHDHLAPADHLLAVDAEVLAQRAAGPPCGPRVTTRPQVISGPASSGQQVWTGSRPRSTSAPSSDDLPAGGARDARPGSCPQRLGHLQQPAGVLQALGRLRLLQVREQRRRRRAARARRRRPCPGHPSGVPNRLVKHRNFVTDRVLEQQRRAARRSTKSLTAVISSRVETGSATRRSSPALLEPAGSRADRGISYSLSY